MLYKAIVIQIVPEKLAIGSLQKGLLLCCALTLCVQKGIPPTLSLTERGFQLR